MELGNVGMPSTPTRSGAVGQAKVNEEEELLTIEGEVELTVKKKKKRKSHEPDDGEAVRMDMMSSTRRPSSPTMDNSNFTVKPEDLDEVRRAQDTGYMLIDPAIKLSVSSPTFRSHSK
jgi:hypothetical protein